MTKEYKVFYKGELIGTTLLEKADPPMGVVYGELIVADLTSTYDRFLEMFKNAEIALDEYPEDGLFSTFESIKDLKVMNSEGIEIKGVGNQITFARAVLCEVSILGVSYPFYGEEFPHHVKAYEDFY